jgi:hypothetical protein
MDWTWEELEHQRDCSLRWDASAMAQSNLIEDWTWEEIERQRDCSLQWDAGVILGVIAVPHQDAPPASRLRAARGGGL